MSTNTITLEGLVGVGKVDLILQQGQQVYAFIGTNGVGKTKCLETLFLSEFNRHQDLPNANLYNAPVKKVHFDGQIVFDFSSTHRNSLGEYRSLYDTRNKELPTHARPAVYLGANARGQITHTNSGGALGKFEDRKNAHISSVLNAIQNREMAQLGMSSNIAAWFVLRAQSANPFQKSGDNRRVEIDTLLKLLHEVDERVDVAFLEIDGADNVAIKVNGVVTQLQHLSSGFTSILKMLQAIVAGYANFTNEVNLQHVRGFVFIDEIESHLHVAWQTHIIPLLKRLFPNTTFYVTTHSPLVLMQVHEGEAYELLRDPDSGIVNSRLIANPSNQVFADLLGDAFQTDLNLIKRKQLEGEDQHDVKQKMLELLRKSRSVA
jgi:predicted ATPase